MHDGLLKDITELNYNLVGKNSYTTFNNVDIVSKGGGIGVINGATVIINGGTFGFVPSKWVPEGYQAVKNGSIWVVSEI